MNTEDRVRALLGDSPATGDEIHFALSKYAAAMESEPSVWKIHNAAADLLEMEAMNLIRKSAVTSTEDISINRGAVAKALMERAQRLRDDVDPDQGVFLTAEFHPDGVPWT